jgi:hypothetical protein
MKKALLILVLSLLTVVLSSFERYNELTVFHEEGKRFWLIMNGVKQNESPLSTVSVSEIKVNYVKLKVIFEDETIADINKKVQLKNIALGKTHTVMVIKQKKPSKAIMRFQSNTKSKKHKK